MATTQLIAAILFLVTVGLIIWGKLDRTLVGLVGAGLMVLAGVMTETQAFGFVDWNVIGILFAVWIIASYFGKTGIPEYLAVLMLRASKRDVAVFLTLMGVLSGFISMFVDNVVVILMMAPVALHVTRRLKLPAFPFLIFIALGANFMGSAMLLGDLPPQMLHSVAGAEFADFMWQLGRPSSFPILTATFLVTAFVMYRFKFKRVFGGASISQATMEDFARSEAMVHIKNRGFAVAVVLFFLATIAAMAFRQFTGLLLGFIAVSGMMVMVLVMEIFRKKFGSPSFEETLQELDWRALLFYVVLFVLVGGVDHVGLIKWLADSMAPLFRQNLVIASSVLYWLTAAIVGIVEHDAYILVFLHLIKDVAATANVNPWPLWWLLLWAGTLGSNLTVAGAPALFVALNVCEKEDACKIGIREFFSYTVPFVLVTLVITFVFALVLWVIPFAG